MNLKITILGCGGSDGVPRIGCNCYVCSSKNPKDKRLRPSILIENDKTKLLIDCSPDFREQALRHNINSVDAIILTHTHADHIMGIPELKQMRNNYKPTVVYMHENDYSEFAAKFSFSFAPTDKIYYKFTKPITFKSFDNITIDNLNIQMIDQVHGTINSQGIVIDKFAYCTDVKSFPEESIKHLMNLDLLILDCLRPSFSPSHFGIDGLLEFIERIKPKKTYLTHMNHHITYDEFKRLLPNNIEPCYDSMILTYPFSTH